MENNIERNIEVDEKSLEIETGISATTLEKINNNSKLRKVFLSLLFTSGLVGSAQFTEAQQIQDSNETKIENTVQENAFQKIAHDIEIKDIKKSLKGYEPVPGGLPLNMVIEKFADKKFKIMDPVVSQTQSAGEMQASVMIMKAGIKGQQFSFIRNLENGTIIIIKLIAIKE